MMWVSLPRPISRWILGECRIQRHCRPAPCGLMKPKGVKSWRNTNLRRPISPPGRKGWRGAAAHWAALRPLGTTATRAALYGWVAQPGRTQERLAVGRARGRDKALRHAAVVGGSEMGRG